MHLALFTSTFFIYLLQVASMKLQKTTLSKYTHSLKNQTYKCHELSIHWRLWIIWSTVPKVKFEDIVKPHTCTIHIKYWSNQTLWYLKPQTISDNITQPYNVGKRHGNIPNSIMQLITQCHHRILSGIYWSSLKTFNPIYWNQIFTRTNDVCTFQL